MLLSEFRAKLEQKYFNNFDYNPVKIFFKLEHFPMNLQKSKATYLVIFKSIIQRLLLKQEIRREVFWNYVNLQFTLQIFLRIFDDRRGLLIRTYFGLHEHLPLTKM